MADFTKGYESSSMEDAVAPHNKTDDKHRPIGTMAIETKKRWKNAPQAFPHEQNDDGGGGGGDA